MTFKILREKIINELERNEITLDTGQFSFPVNAEFYLYKNFEKEMVIDENIVVKYQTKGQTMNIVPWLVVSREKQIPMGFLTLRKKKFGKFVYHESEYAILKNEFQGKGIMQRVYKEIVDSAGLNIVANNTQSSGARKLWLNLSKDPSLRVWAVFGDIFILDPKNPKKDYIFGIKLSDKFQTKTNTKELTNALVQDKKDGSVKNIEVYNDTGTENDRSALVLTKRDGIMDKILSKMNDLEDLETLPHKSSNDKNIELMYQAINSILLNK